MMKKSEKPVLIAVPTNDGITIFKKMLGMAKYFYIYALTSEGRLSFVEKRENPYETTLQHLKTLDVYGVISDCKIIISSFIGKKGQERLRAKGVELYFIKGDIQESLKSIFNNE
ncbi:MAG: hypothetical protein JXR46_01055 [Calditrichaceae bacterium]|nr:hypothetical protein [Calditrichaceae bacterium]MBN2707604.1 hypothetical protein [Calditrichaceae bacterium]RQV93219.1 MAG: hypothetical protein EH224_13080 [Calditrichota bacterium]